MTTELDDNEDDDDLDQEEYLNEISQVCSLLSFPHMAKLRLY